MNSKWNNIPKPQKVKVKKLHFESFVIFLQDSYPYPKPEKVKVKKLKFESLVIFLPGIIATIASSGILIPQKVRYDKKFS